MWRYGIDRFDFSASHITREFENSLRRLKTDYIDLLQVHDVEFGSIDQIIHETIPALRLLQQQGKVHLIVITGYWPDLLASIAESTAVDTVLNYCHFNLLMNDMDQTLTPTATRLGIGLLNASPLHMGLLGGRTVPPWHPAPSRVKSIARKIVELCKAYSVSAPALALNACLEHEAVASTLIGLGNAAQVDDASQALEFQPPPGLKHAIAPLIASVLNTAWSSGRPENQPAEVHAT